MSDKFFPDISVGNFALDILKDMSKDPNSTKPALKESTTQSSNAPDVSKITVPQDFVSLVTEGKKSTKKIAITETTENKLSSLVERLSTLISEARVIMEEISAGATTVGNIGVNMAGAKKNKNKVLINKLLKNKKHV